jgi:hypothetical protein
MNNQRDVKFPSSQPSHSEWTESSRSRAKTSLHARHAQLRDHRFFGRRMRPYVNRVRLKVLDLSNRKVVATREHMEAILMAKKIPPPQARDAVLATLNVAANYHLEPLRRIESVAEYKRAVRRLDWLIKLIEAFEQLVSKLPPGSKGKLNRIVRRQDLRNFDSEVFTDIVRDAIHELSSLSPAVVASRARSILIDPSIKASNHAASAPIFHSAPPKIIELWETIPPQTRAQVEADVRRLPTCESLLEFFRYLVNALKRFRPQTKRGRRPAIEQLFVVQTAAIWRRLGLKPGRTYLPYEKRHAPSSFQRYCDSALTALGYKTHISARQITNVRRKTTGRKPKPG